jgi:hypothetical protein
LAGNEELSDDAKAELLRDHARYKAKAAKMRENRESRPAWIDEELTE